MTKNSNNKSEIVGSTYYDSWLQSVVTRSLNIVTPILSNKSTDRTVLNFSRSEQRGKNNYVV